MGRMGCPQDSRARNLTAQEHRVGPGPQTSTVVDSPTISRFMTVSFVAVGPTGQRWAPAWSTKFQLPSAMKFMVLTQITLPIEPNGGRHVYSFRLEGSHERFDIPLDVVVQ